MEVEGGIVVPVSGRCAAIVKSIGSAPPEACTTAGGKVHAGWFGGEQVAYLGADSGADEHFNEDSVGDRVAVTALWRFSTGP